MDKEITSITFPFGRIRCRSLEARAGSRSKNSSIDRFASFCAMAAPAAPPPPPSEVTKATWLAEERRRLVAAAESARAGGGLSLAALLRSLEILGTGYDIVFGAGWAAALANACKGDLHSHLSALEQALAAAGAGGGGAAGGAGADVTIEAIVDAQLAAFGGREGVRRDGPHNIVNHLLWIQRILAFVARFLEVVVGIEGQAKAETWTAARAAYAQFFSPFHPTVLQWAVPPLLGLVPKKASMLASMGPMSEADGDAAAAALVRDGLAPVAARLLAILAQRDLLFTDTAGAAF